MKAKIKSKLEELRTDYTRIKGKPFIHFYCPILFRDEDVPLCEGHIVNKAFHNTSRAWTVQREDVDSFYGSRFESDFVAIEYYTENLSPEKVLTDKKLSKTFSPSILVDNKRVEHFVAEGSIPDHFIRVEVDSNGQSAQLGLKISPEDFSAAINQNWELEVSKDLRIPALVSLIKSAHLTLFKMLGYRYALSAGGYFVGRDILGEFFQNNHQIQSKSEVLENALHFFREFANMVRPVGLNSFGFQGTITDKQMLICEGSGGLVWAQIVYIRTSKKLHSVMLPVFDHPDAVATFTNFLQNETELIEVKACRFEKNQWQVNKDSVRLNWPKTGILYPKMDRNSVKVA